MHQEIIERFNSLKEKQLSIDITRGKPDKDQLDLSNELIDMTIPFISEDGEDLRNYREQFGIIEARRLSEEPKTLENLSKKYKISRERVRQIINHAKSLGIEVRSYEKRSEHLRNMQTKKVASEIQYALENLYGTPEYFAWQKDFRKRTNPTQKKFLRDVMKKAWKHNLLDPLDSIEYYLEPTDKHYKVVNLKNQGYTATQVAKKMGKSKPTVDNLIREARAYGLYPEPKSWRLKQIKAVSLTQDEIDRRLDEIRTQMKLGMNISQIEKMQKTKKSIHHFVARHHYLAKFEQKKRRIEY